MRRKKSTLMMGTIEVHDLESLCRYFAPESAMKYFRDGKLVEWLSERYYEDEAEALAAIDVNDPNVERKVCEVLNVSYEEHFDTAFIARIEEKRRALSERTDDVGIINNARITALNQEDLADLIDLDEPLIYLCGEKFTIPIRVGNKHYIGVLGTSTIKIRAESQAELDARYIVIENANLPWGFEACRRAAETGNVRAMLELAKIYGSGSLGCGYGLDIINPDPEQAKAWYKKQALNWLEKAAELGNVEAMMNLAFKYKYGDGIEVDENRAKTWYEKAAALGDCKAMMALVDYYLDGVSNEFDPDKAREWMEKAANAGNLDAMKRLADWYTQGYVVKADPDKAREWEAKVFYGYKQRAETGDLDAMWQLAMCYENGKGVAADPDKAKEWGAKVFNGYKQRAETGDLDAMWQLAMCYENGKGVAADPDKSQEWGAKAFYGYKQRAEAGDLDAIHVMSELADHYIYESDPDNAEEWYAKICNYYKQRAEVGDSNAMSELASYYQCGVGVEVDHDKAKDWQNKAFNGYKQRAETGDLYAMYRLAGCYEFGEGVEGDRAKAQEWYAKASFFKCRQDAKRGEVIALLWLSWYYETGKVTPVDTNKASLYFKRAEALVHGNCYIRTTTYKSNQSMYIERRYADFCQSAVKFKSIIQIGANGRMVDAKSIVMVMSLGFIDKDTEISIAAVGADAKNAVDTLIDFIDSNFGE